MRSRVLLPGMAAALLLSACNASTTVDTDGMSSSSSVSSEETSSAAATSSAAPADAVTSSVPAAVSSVPAAPPAAVRVIEVSVADWEFTPSVIQVKKGEKVTVRLKGVSGVHSFGIRDLNINVPIQAGETKDVEIPTDQAGTFEFRCLVPCGPGHREMKGQLIIQ